MCLAVYLASDIELPIIEWDKENRAFNVVPLTENENEVKSQFSLPFVVYVGSHLCCGCGFIKEGEVGKDLELVQENYYALGNYIKSLKVKGASFQIYSCWEGDQGSIPDFQETLTIETICKKSFEFKEKAFYESVKYFV